MTIAIDSISQRKLILVKQLYELALSQSELHHSIINRIMSVIEFDLAVETLLKVVVSTLDQSKPPAEQFNGILNQCEKLLTDNKLPVIPHRSQILYTHSLRNDTQHKARYPYETDVNDCRTYTRDFCRDMIMNVWGLSFDLISPIDLIDDALLRELLYKSQTYISNGDYRKAIILAENAFHWASLAIYKVLPETSVKIYSTQYPDFKALIQEINSSVSAATSNATYYAALFSSGINLVSYKRYIDISPFVEYRYQNQITQSGESISKSIQIYWNSRNPNEEDALWLHDFTVNAITNWQFLGLQPIIQSEQVKLAQSLLNFGQDVIEIP